MKTGTKIMFGAALGAGALYLLTRGKGDDEPSGAEWPEGDRWAQMPKSCGSWTQSTSR